MPIDRDIRPILGDHLVQFYASEDDLTDLVGDVIAHVLARGDAAVVIPTTAHQRAVRRRLIARGIDVDGAVADDCLVLHDAADLLTKFMVDGRPDQACFHRMFESIVAGPVRSERAVYAFGDLAALLWDAGNASAALELEHLWDELTSDFGMSVLCAYPYDLFALPEHTEDFLHVCRAHSDVVAGAPVADETETTQRLLATVGAPRRARTLVADTLAAWGRADLLEPCVLVVSELVANAVRYGGSDLTVSLGRDDGGVVIAVGDTADAAPEIPEFDRGALGGRGVRLVSDLARDWGYERCPGGKIVWATIDQDLLAVPA